MSARLESSVPAQQHAPALTSADFSRLRQLIESTLGIAMPDSKRTMLENRLLRRLRALGLASFSEYCEVLKQSGSSGPELGQFLDLVTTNKTSFFREPPQLDFLSQLLAQKLDEASGSKRPLRVWSAACSTGEEVWTLVMMLDSICRQRSLSCEYEVLGSDVSGRVLGKAVAAKYDQEQLEAVPPQLRLRHFMRSKKADACSVRIVPEMRAKAGFFRQNLMAASYGVGSPVDVLLLRNALIYFSRERQIEIVARATKYLSVGGLFLVSLTESLHGFPLPLTHLGRSVYRRDRG